MAKDPRKALDDKTAKLSRGGQIKTGKEHESYQESQQQLLAIQAEQKQNLAVARAESKASFENNQTLMQAAELGAISAAEAEQSALSGDIGGQQLNPATQAVLAKYGMGQPKFVKTQSHSQQVTKQNITINNNTNVSTTNDVKVPANIGGPLQGRPLQFKSPATKGDSTGKFKAWISSAFARQNEEGTKRDREYRNRESSLTRSANKMMKKLEDIGKTIGTRMDPRKIGSTWQSQLKTLLFLFGFGYLTSNWTKILGKVASIEDSVKKFFSYFKKGTFLKDLAEIFGGKPGESAGEAFKNLLIGDDGLLGMLKDYFKTLYKDRAEAIKSIEFPTLNPKSVIESLGELGKYLSKILSAIVGGTDAMKTSYTTAEADTDSYKQSLKHLTEARENDYKYSPNDTFKVKSKDSKGKEIEYKADAGVLSILNPNSDYRGITHYTLNDDGTLNKNYITEATIGSSSELSRIFDQIKEGNTKNVSSAAQQLYNLFESSKERGIAVVTPDLVYNALPEGEQNKLLRSGDIKFERYHVVRREKTNKDYELESRGKISPVDRAMAANITNKGSSTFTAFANGPGYALSPGLAAAADMWWDEHNKTTHRFELVKNIDPKAGYTDTGTTEEVAELSPKAIATIGKFMSESPNAVNVFNLDQESNKADIEKILLEGNGLNRRATQYQKVIEDFDSKWRTGSTYHVAKRDDGSEYLWTQGGGGSEGAAYWKKLKKQYEKERAVYDKAKNFLSNREAIQEEGFTGNYSKVAETEAEWQKKHDEIWQPYEERTKDNRVNAVANNVSDKLYRVSGGMFGTRQEKLTATKTIDGATLKHRKEYLFKILEDSGLSRAAAAGIIGNLEGEGLNRDPSESARVSDPTSKDKSTYSMGIAMFNSQGELPNLKSWAKKNGLNYNTFETQAQYIAQHPVTRKIAKETEKLSSENALKKSTIIWGHDFERFKGYDAADSHGNIIGQGAYITINNTEKYKNDKFRSDGKFHGDENYTERIQKGLNTYSTYVDSDLSNITVNASRSFKEDDDEEVSEEKREEKSFLEILKDKVTQLITSFGTAFSETTAKVQDVQNSINEVVKKNFITDGIYEGPITQEFLSYDDYLRDHGNLPEGLNRSQWENKVYDTTGKFPDRLELREDSKGILSKYEKGGEPEKKTEVKPEEQITKTDEVSATEISNKEGLKFNDIFDAVAEKNDPLKELKDDVSNILICVKGANNLSEIELGALGEVVDSNRQGNLIAANSSKHMVNAINASSQNRLEKTPSYSSNKIITDGVIDYG